MSSNFWACCGKPAVRYLSTYALWDEGYIGMLTILGTGPRGPRPSLQYVVQR